MSFCLILHPHIQEWELKAGVATVMCKKNKEVNADNKFGIDVILMNHNMSNIQNVIDLLGGD